MSRMWTPQPIEVYKQWVQTILDEASDQLTDWESKFIESIEGRLANGWNLTQGQANSLEQIYADKTK